MVNNDAYFVQLQASGNRQMVAEAFTIKHVIQKIVVGCGFPLVIAVSEKEIPGIEHGPLGWHTNELQEVFFTKILKFIL